MDVDASFVADGETPEAIEPGECAFDDPAIPAETFAGLDAASGDARRDAASPAGAAAATMIIGLVRMQLSRPAPRPAALAADRRNCIEHLLEGHAVMHVGPGQGECERDTLTVCDEVAFRAGTATIGRVRPDRGAPFFAAMEELSSAARLQSMRLASCRRRSNSRCNRSQTPAACQSRRRRQQVTPEPQPISRGSISQGMPLRSTNRMPVSAARAEIGGRPPFGRGRGGGSKGSRIDHRLSESWGAGIPLHESKRIKVQGLLKGTLSPGPNDDVHVLAERGEAAEQPVAGETGQPSVHQRGDFRLIEPDQPGGLGLGEVPTFDRVADVDGKLGLRQFLLRFGDSEISEHIAGAWGHREVIFVLASHCS